MDQHNFNTMLFPNGLDYQDLSDNDFLFIKQMYPPSIRRIQKEVEEQCDKLEYEGSCMFDQCFDRVHLGVVVNQIYETLQNIEKEMSIVKEASLDEEASVDSAEYAEYRPPCRPGQYCPSPRPDYRPDGSPDWIRNLIEVLLYQEMMNRRTRYRKHKRWL